ncbi:hypothetical protein llap_6475 [Limosa lapponica baueri]|uniref:Uncharacterized protein n=1 Tax=Limosa lapponica baueri TaxID=1758121 RepID=A0A2I0UAV4_LIMLA|nr:hypothetical protein llap_6475 [Limosa lapponica baueri]
MPNTPLCSPTPDNMRDNVTQTSDNTRCKKNDFQTRDALRQEDLQDCRTDVKRLYGDAIRELNVVAHYKKLLSKQRGCTLKKSGFKTWEQYWKHVISRRVRGISGVLEDHGAIEIYTGGLTGFSGVLEHHGAIEKDFQGTVRDFRYRGGLKGHRGELSED